jgi:hypothetical protein
MTVEKRTEAEMPNTWRIIQTVIDRLNNTKEGQEIADTVLSDFCRRGLLAKENENDIKALLVRFILFELSNTYDGVKRLVLEDALRLHQFVECGKQNEEDES